VRLVGDVSDFIVRKMPIWPCLEGDDSTCFIDVGVTARVHNVAHTAYQGPGKALSGINVINVVNVVDVRRWPWSSLCHIINSPLGPGACLGAVSATLLITVNVRQVCLMGVRGCPSGCPGRCLLVEFLLILGVLGGVF